MADQQFIVEVRIITECQEQVDEAFIANWVTEQFEGSDVGSVELRECNEVK
jgi:hypothetical protein